MKVFTLIKLYLLILLSVFVGSCTNNKEKARYTIELDSLQSENRILIDELDKAKIEIDELKNTPELRLINAKNLLASNNLENAENELQF